MELRYGTVLPNGALVLDHVEGKGGDGERALIGVVLATLPDNPYHPYATWTTVRDSEDDLVETHTGHYFEKPSEAIQDYRKRRELESLHAPTYQRA